MYKRGRTEMEKEPNRDKEGQQEVSWETLFPLAFSGAPIPRGLKL